jgi:effector-binding domain-containing protein
MIDNCEAIERPAQPVLSIRTRTSVQALPEALGKGYQKVFEYLTGLGEHPAGAPFVAYYNMDMQDLDIEIGFPLSKELPDKEDIRCGEIPAGKFASTVYTGPYQEMPPAYEALTVFMQENGYEPTGVVYEYYLNDPQVTPPQALMTQIVFPLKSN